jgi:non-canonical purine NTP pyrophosphatase (RdgB/HAM1 family)
MDLEITLVTGNPDKAESAQRRLKPLGISVDNKKTEILEPQADEIEEIARYKVKQAYEELQSPVLISDTGWVITGLNGFPGPYMHYVSEWFTENDFARLISGLDNREVIIENIAAFKDQNELKLFKSKRKGQLLDTPKGEKGFPIDKVATFRNDQKTLSECMDEDLNRFDKKLNDSIWTQFGEWYSQR